jgi:hypothetical protein
LRVGNYAASGLELAMKSETGVGVVKKAGERELKVVKDAAGKPTPASEGFFSYSFTRPENFEEVIAYYEQKDEKGVPVNAPYVTNEKGEKVYLSAEQAIVELVGAELERAAKANAYQKTVAKFKPAEDPKAAFEKIVRTFMSLGLPEDLATQHARAAIEENERNAASGTEQTA